MVSKIKISMNSHNVALMFPIPPHEVLENLHFHKSLVVEALLIADQFQREHRAGLVIEYLHHLRDRNRHRSPN